MESDDRARVPAEPAGLWGGRVWWLVCGAALLVLGGMWLLPAATVRANTLTVTNCMYGGVGSLFNQIAAATPGDTIVFTAGLNCTSAGAGPIVGIGYTISQDLTIDGSGASIVVDGSCDWTGLSGPCLNTGAGRTNFFINGGTVVLKGLTIQHGYGAAGGGIDNSATLTVTNCTITQNSAGGIAGNGIYNSGTLVVTNSTLSYNTSALFNGANSGGGIYNSGTLSVTNSTFDHNVTSGGTDGGGINNDGGAATVTNSTFSANNAGGNGGGIENNGGMLGVMNSTFSGNDCTYGGGIHNSGTATVTNSTFSGPAITGYGGGIANTGSGTLAVTNSTFSPHMNPVQGGGIYNSGTLTTVTNSTIAGNGVSGSTTGGGIYNSSGTVILTNTVVASNAGGELVGTFSGNNNLIDDTSAITGSNNITNTSAGLGTLGNYGGPTQTIPLTTGSPAIAHGDRTVCNQTGTGKVNGVDQRGVTRPTSLCAIGAYEPLLSAISPIFGTPAGGTTVTLTGSGYAAGATVSIGGMACGNVQVPNSTTLQCTTGAHAAGPVDVVVTENSQTGTLLGAYTYGTLNPLPPPKPGSGSGSPAALPSSRPVGPANDTPPNPLPPPRP